MPRIKSAKKQMKQDIKRTLENRVYEKKIDDIMNHMEKKAEGKENPKMVSEAHSIIDKAAKKNVIHGNKANRLKARVSRLNAK